MNAALGEVCFLGGTAQRVGCLTLCSGRAGQTCNMKCETPDVRGTRDHWQCVRLTWSVQLISHVKQRTNKIERRLPIIDLGRDHDSIRCLVAQSNVPNEVIFSRNSDQRISLFVARDRALETKHVWFRTSHDMQALVCSSHQGRWLFLSAAQQSLIHGGTPGDGSRRPGGNRNVKTGRDSRRKIKMTGNS